MKKSLALIKKGFKVLSEEGPVVFLKKSYQFFSYRIINRKLGRLILPIYLSKLRKFQYRDLNHLVDFAFNSFLIKPMQIKEEIIELLKILEKRKPKTILEIGTANGGTLFLFSQLASEDATIISIDLPEGPFGGGYPEWKIPLYKSFVRKNQKIYLIREDSHKQETLEKVKEILGDKKIDFLFIDGDHSYEGVKRDFEMYSGLVGENGLIAFHDIVRGLLENVGGVPEFWKEIKKNFDYKEFVKNWDQGGYGIGIIFL